MTLRSMVLFPMESHATVGSIEANGIPSSVPSRKYVLPEISV